MKMLALMLISLCTVSQLTTGLTQAQWQRPAFYYNRVQHLTPVTYTASPTSLLPSYLQQNSGSKPDCNKDKHQNEVTFQSGTNSFGRISQAQTNPPSNRKPTSLTVPITGFQPSTVFPFTTNYQAQAQTQSQTSIRNNNVPQNNFHQPEQFTVTPELLHHSAAANANHNNNQYQSQNDHQNQQNHQNTNSKSTLPNNINITTSNLYQIPGMEHFKNCVPIPGTDGACVILQDDTKSSDHPPEASTSKAQPPNKELIYAPPKSPPTDFNFKPLLGGAGVGGNQNQNKNNNYFAYNVDDSRNRNPNSFNQNNRFNNPPISSFARGNNGLVPDTPFNLRNPYPNIPNPNINNNNNRFRPGFRIRNNNNNNNINNINTNNNPFRTPDGGVKGFASEPLPIPQAFHSMPNENVSSGENNKHGESSVAGEKVQPPFDNLPESREFYMRFLRLWSMYHKRYGCAFKPMGLNVPSNSKRSVKKLN